MLFRPLSFIEAVSKRRLMADLAVKMQQELGLVTQAARLLYEAEDFPSLCNLLTSEISSQLVTSASLNPQANHLPLTAHCSLLTTH